MLVFDFELNHGLLTQNKTTKERVYQRIGINNMLVKIARRQNYKIHHMALRNLMTDTKDFSIKATAKTSLSPSTPPK
jgi:hypothetical protein